MAPCAPSVTTATGTLSASEYSADQGSSRPVNAMASCWFGMKAWKYCKFSSRAEDQAPVGSQPTSPKSRTPALRGVEGPRFQFLAEFRDGGERRRRATDQLGRGHRRRVAVRHHRAVLLHAEGHRDGRVPARNAAGEGQVHVFLPGQDLPVVVPVAVVPERGRQPGPQPQPRRGNRLVGHPARAAAHPVAPDFGAGAGAACGSPVKMMSWNTVPVRSRSNPSAAGVRTAESGSKRRVGFASMYGRLRRPRTAGKGEFQRRHRHGALCNRLSACGS